MLKKFSFKNGEIALNFVNGFVESICINNEELIYRNIPFFLLKFRDKKNNTTYIDSTKFRFLEFSDNTATYENDFAKISLNVFIEDDALVWKIKVINKTKQLIEQVELMSLGLYPKLSDEEGGNGAIVIPYNEGVKVTNLQRRLSSPFGYLEPEYPSLSKYFIFPNMICSQFMAYLKDGYGLYFGMHDEKRTTKHIDFNYVNNALKIQLRTFTNVGYGEDYESTFPFVIKIFKGNEYDAFEIYRLWFYEHLPLNIRKIKDNTNLPLWYKESPIVVTYPIRGKNDSDVIMATNKNYPYMNGIKLIDEVSQKTNSKVLNLLMHWEGSAPWAPPYYWPPFGGEEQFANYVKKVHESNHYIGLYTSGLGWTQKSFRGNYSKEDEFEKDNLSNIMCTNSDGTMKSTIVSNIRFGYDMCPALPKTKDIIKNETEKLIASGIDYIQVLDQNHGGCSYFCYNENHGHVPSPGSWQQEEVSKLLANIDCKNALLGCESAASESLIPYLLFSDNRFILNYYIGYPVPLYSYIYHEFVNNFMGNQICMALENKPYSYLYRLAYAFICGDMFTFVFNDNSELASAWCSTELADKDNAYAFTKELNLWRRIRSDFLHEGKVIKPIPFKCERLPLRHEDGTIMQFDSVLTSAFNYGRYKVQFLVNYDLVEHEVVFDKDVDVYFDPEFKNVVCGTKIVIPPQKVAMIKL